jgi:hypothetical protein
MELGSLPSEEPGEVEDESEMEESPGEENDDQELTPDRMEQLLNALLQ